MDFLASGKAGLIADAIGYQLNPSAETNKRRACTNAPATYPRPHSCRGWGGGGGFQGCRLQVETRGMGGCGIRGNWASVIYWGPWPWAFARPGNYRHLGMPGTIAPLGPGRPAGLDCEAAGRDWKMGLCPGGVCGVKGGGQSSDGYSGAWRRGCTCRFDSRSGNPQTWGLQAGAGFGEGRNPAAIGPREVRGRIQGNSQQETGKIKTGVVKIKQIKLKPRKTLRGSRRAGTPYLRIRGGL